MPNPTPQPSPRDLVPKPVLWGLAAVVLIFAGLAFGYLLRQTVTMTNTANTVVVTNNTHAANTNAATNTTNTTVNDNTNVTNSNTNTTSAIADATHLPKGSITWQAKKTIPDLHLYNFKNNPDVDSATYYTVGKIATGPYSGGSLVLEATTCPCPQQYPSIAYYIQLNGKLTSTSSAPTAALPAPTGFDATKISSFVQIDIAELNYPDTLQGPEPRQNLVRDSAVTGFFTSTNLKKAFVDPTYGQAWTTNKQSAPSMNPSLGAADNNRNGFYFQAADGEIVAYKLVVDFIPQTVENGYAFDQAPVITWTDGTKNTTKYTISNIGGCGSSDYAAVQDPAKISVTRDLVAAGTSSKGDTIYAFKDTNNAILKDYYKNFYSLGRDANGNESFSKLSSYATFLTGRPMVFFVDPFGRLIRMVSNDFLPAVECGKPVIYLYPPSTTTVDVHLAPQGGFTYSEPAYGQGWHVKAEPNGKLTDLASGRVYPYLFWEGRGGIYAAPDKGFVVAKNDVHTFLAEKLSKLGLTAQESSDFMAFWEPRMQSAPWYFVSFATNKVMDRLAPLSVSPKPDTTIRILMDYRPLAKPMAVESYPIVTPDRHGFTVVEWGGVLR